jgi:hypothetical protein
MKTKQSLGWIFVITGSMFLLSGLVVMLFATLNPNFDGSAGDVIDPSFWVSLANSVMAFIINLLEVDWTPVRVGVFLIIIGIIMDGSGAYLMVSREGKRKR